MKQKEILIIAVTIFLTVIAWVILEVRGIRDETPTEADINAVQFNYTIDTELLDILEGKTP